MSELVFDIEIESSVVDVEIVSPTVDVEVTESVVAVITVEGPPGAPGPPGSGVIIYGSEPGGVKDGANTVFTTAHPYRPGTIAVFLNGLREHYYSETSSTTITFDDPPGPADLVTVDYLKG